MASVLIVEDEAAILMLAESVIQDAGYDTLSAASLPEAAGSSSSPAPASISSSPTSTCATCRTAASRSAR